MRIEVLVPHIPSFLEPSPKSAAQRRCERRAKIREIMVWSDCPGGYSEKDWRDLKRRQGGLCAHCQLTDGRNLFRVRKVPPHMGGTNFIGNIIGLCWDCKNWRHGRYYSELRYRARIVMAKAAAGEYPRNNLQHRRHGRFLALAVERGFMREPGVPYLKTDPDACVCKKGQEAHRLGSPVCKFQEAS